VADLLDGLRQAGADEQAAALTGRLPAAGMFQLFLEQEGLADQFRFGDGRTTAPRPRHGVGETWTYLDSVANLGRGGLVDGSPRAQAFDVVLVEVVLERCW